MILVVCVNPALDVTHHVPGVDWSGVNRPTQVRARPGGKGLNVASTLWALRRDTLVVGLAGGITGDAVRAGLDSAGVPGRFAAIAGETRRTFAVADTARHRTALFNEPGPRVTRPEWERFLVLYEESLAGSLAVVLSGSLPPGLPTGSYATLAARAAPVPVILDAEGAALLSGAAAGPAIVKPNLDELERTVGRRLTGPHGAAAVAAAPGAGARAGPARAGATRVGATRAETALAARELMAAGAGAVVVSLGHDGLLAVTGEGTWHAAPPAKVAGNPTGAGDAVVAGLAHGLVSGLPWPDRLRQAAALGTAAAAAPVAGQFDQAGYARALAGVTVEPWAED